MSKRKFNSNNNYESDCNSNLEILDKIRREDILEGYQEETEESFSLNKRPVLSDSEESIDEDAPTSSSNKSLNSSSKSYKRYATANSEESEEKSPEVKKPSFSENNVAARLMQKMGFTGKGLGKHEQGIQSPIEASSTRGRLGLGHDAQRDLQLDYDEKWDTESEVKNVEEYPSFLKCEELMESQRAIQALIDQAPIYSNLVMGKPVTDIVSQDRYCNGKLISDLVNAKNVFNHLTEHQLNEARARANPYETIKSGIFQNRAAMKTANLDRIFGWRLSQEFDDTVRGSKNPFKEHQDQERKNDSRHQSAFYFVDVCAGPGGFSEYMLWRKAFYNAKGFGFTLKGPDDFKLWKFKAASSAYFDPFYGKNEDGNIMAPENLETLEEYITRKTNNQKVHLVMADGGFSVKDDYNLQEVLSKRLYLCQFIAGLSLCRAEDKEKKKRGGNFVCKLFDIFTPFSVGLIYLMYLSFDQISLHKPNTSRPANSERYIFCENLNSFGATYVKKYLVQINNELQKLEQAGKNKENDILEILPAEIIEKDEEFFNYVKNHNEDLIQRQILYLDKYRKFAKNPGAYDPDQGDLRVRCLEYWEVPDKKKEDMYNRRQNVGDLFHEVTKWKMPINEYRFKTNAFTLDVLRNQEDKRLRLKEVVATLLTDDKEPMFVVSVGDKVYCRDWNGNDWRFLNELSLVLPPNTVLLAHVAIKTIRGQNSERVLRILDAPVLDGDWIADLSYTTRILAIKKFCTTVNKPGHKQFDSRTRKESFIAHNELVCAEVLSISRLVEYLEKMKANYRDGQTVLFPCESEPHSANDEKKEYFACKAVRFMNILKDNFITCWSNSSKRVYYYNRETRQSYFDDVAEKEHVFSSFWDTIKKSNDYSSPHEYTWLWKWQGDSHSRYGPAKILSSDHDNDVTSQNVENSHPTLVSLEQLIEDENARIPRV